MNSTTSSPPAQRRGWHEFWRDFEWPTIGVLALVALVLGAIGYAGQFRAAGTKTFWDIIYLDVQLFLLTMPDLPEPLHPALNIARFLAPSVAGYTAWQALAKLFADQFQSLKLRLLRDHVVVCGLGRKGFVIAREFLRRGQEVIVIEQDEENDLVRQCRDLGGVVLIGDGSESDLLRRAGVAHAARLFALCGDDGVNAEVAVHAVGLLPERKVPLTCVAHILDPQLCALLREREFESHLARPVHLDFFNVFELGARALLEEHCFNRERNDGRRPPHFVIVGLGHLGQSLIVTAARHWWLSEERADRKLTCTLIDVHAQKIADSLRARYPGLSKTCDLRVCETDVSTADFLRVPFLAGARNGGERTSVFVCLDDDSLGLSTALTMARLTDGAQSTIIVRMTQDAGLATLLRDAPGQGGRLQHLRAFALLDRACQPAQVLRGAHEILARAIHAEYLRHQRAAGDTPETNPSMCPWDELSDDLRQANRQQADHLRTKLATVGCQIEPMADWTEPLFTFAAEDVERLAEHEHRRWMAAKVQAGWTHGPRKDASKRTHPNLVAYADLSESDKEKDRETVHAIPRLLALVGFRVQPASHPAGRLPETNNVAT